ncbi:MAG: ABC transporter permease, partial [Acidobacteriaceae bacterium]|nr:ABC transporter permease [Acidobacteriaceae bacterium]
MSAVLQDLRFCYRELRKNPGLALTAILSITLGIGATTAVFSVIYGLLVNPFPYQGANRMVYLNVVDQAGNDREIEFTGPQLKVLKQAKCIESLAV